MDAEQVLDELEFLAGVEHALIVEFLTVQCALGHDLDPAEGGARTPVGRAVADQAGALAFLSMIRFRNINFGLVGAGRPPALDRGTGIPDAAGVEIPLGPPTTAQLESLLVRAEGIAAAVARRYAALVPAVTTDPVFGPELTELLRPIVVEDATHVTALDDLRTLLAGSAPAGLLVTTRRNPADSFEQRLLDLGDRCYQQILATLRPRFEQSDLFVQQEFSSLATRAMQGELDGADRALVQRGLLPAFTTP